MADYMVWVEGPELHPIVENFPLGIFIGGRAHLSTWKTQLHMFICSPCSTDIALDLDSANGTSPTGTLEDRVDAERAEAASRQQEALEALTGNPRAIEPSLTSAPAATLTRLV